MVLLDPRNVKNPSCEPDVLAGAGGQRPALLRPPTVVQPGGPRCRAQVQLERFALDEFERGGNRRELRLVCGREDY